MAVRALPRSTCPQLRSVVDVHRAPAATVARLRGCTGGGRLFAARNDLVELPVTGIHEQIADTWFIGERRVYPRQLCLESGFALRHRSIDERVTIAHAAVEIYEQNAVNAGLGSLCRFIYHAALDGSLWIEINIAGEGVMRGCGCYDRDGEHSCSKAHAEVPWPDRSFRNLSARARGYYRFVSAMLRAGTTRQSFRISAIARNVV
jgi:hypothetical protein